MSLPTRLLVGMPLIFFTASTVFTLLAMKRGNGISPAGYLVFAGIGIFSVGIASLFVSGEKIQLSTLAFPQCVYAFTSGGFWAVGLLAFGQATLAGVAGWQLTLVGNGSTFTVLFFELILFGVTIPVSTDRFFMSLFLYTISNMLLWPK